IGVYPPDARVRVSAPEHLSRDAIRMAVVSRLGWIRRKRRHMLAQPRQSARQFVTGESHWFRGRRYRLDVRATAAKTRIVLQPDRMWLHARPQADIAARRRVLERWYRQQMQDRLPALLDQWQPIVGETVAECRIKRMKTRWGSCNIAARRIWLNLDLIRKPPACLEYVLVHEMVHLLERQHNARFQKLLDGLLP